MEFYNYLLNSARRKEKTINSMEDILQWIEKKNNTTKVKINKIDLSSSNDWYYDKDDGLLRNKKNSFFQIAGIQKMINNKVQSEQPIIIQNEIGYLGLICKIINGILYFLMQAKIEPGNINKVQISPTIQATKSNFTLKHGGDKPQYLEYFLNADNYDVIVDQIQSEQSSRFYKKRNRNIIIKIDSEIEITDNHMWMTLGQIKELLKIDNLINMDTRTVISCIPFYKLCCDSGCLRRNSTNHVQFPNQSDIRKVFHLINNQKMFNESEMRIVPLSALKSWIFDENQIVSTYDSDFKVIFCEIEIEGREVSCWNQPLIESNGKAILGLFTCIENGIRKFLVKLTKEIGCFDTVELGPTVQAGYTSSRDTIDEITSLFYVYMENDTTVLYDVILSEEGGRFYHEENRNIIIEIDRSIIKEISNEYIWLDYATINYLIQFNNIVNIQLRNLLSLWEV